MRWLTSALLIFPLTVRAFSSDQIASTSAVPCSDNATKTAACNISKKDLRDARAAFSRALKLEHSNRLEEAFAEFEEAARLAPQDVQFLTAREMLRQQLVYDYLQRGNTSMLKGRPGEALGEFRSAINLDPQNEFAQQRLRDALGSSTPKVSTPQVVANTAEIELAPLQRRADFHYRGDARALISEIGTTFEIAVTFDDSVAARRVRFDIENVDFYTAMQAASAVTKNFWTPIDEKQILVAANTPDNHRLFDRMMLRTFYVPGASTPQELNDITNVLRSLFDIRFVMQQAQSSTITVRAPRNPLNAATQFMENLDSARPQVLLDVHAYEVSRTFMRNIGMHIPYQFRLFNIPAAALAALGGQNIQDLINQLIASGGINQANTTALSALLAQLQSQQNSIFSQPLATFGGGLTFFGLSLDQLNATLSVNENSIKTLEHATLRASEGKDATFHVGTRFPILNASFAPIFNTPAIAQNIQNNTFQSAFPSFNYEDLGLNIKAKPDIHGNSDVSLQLELEIRALGGASLNGVPVISNRQYKGSITLRNGEPAVVAGSVSRTEQRSLNGIPGLGQFPGLNKVMATNNKEEDDDELLIVITPHVISTGEANPGSEIWMSAAQ
jgi:general secretion pathway protein D